MKILIILFCLAIFGKVNAQYKVDGDDASFYSQKVETTLKAGKSYNVSVSFKNSGDKTWTKGDYWIIYADPRMNATNNNLWGIDSVKVKKNVKPGKTYEFKFQVTAPIEPGTYFFSWQMCSQNGTFGLGTDLQEISVTN